MAEPPAEHSINFETSFYSSRVPFEAANVRIRGDVPIDVKDISAEKNLPKAVIMKKAVPKKSKEETKIKVSQKETSAKSDDQASLIPRATVKRIMKFDESVKQVQQDAVVLLSKATEIFIGNLATESHKRAKKHNRNNSLQYKDVASVTSSNKNLEFLKYIIPNPPTESDEDEDS